MNETPEAADLVAKKANEQWHIIGRCRDFGSAGVAGKAEFFKGVAVFQEKREKGENENMPPVKPGINFSRQEKNGIQMRLYEQAEFKRLFPLSNSVSPGLKKLAQLKPKKRPIRPPSTLRKYKRAVSA